jgi:hypothetical protein
MPKSDKSTVNSRVNDAVRLLVAGAGLPEIRQFAKSHGWNVGDRQIRRYQELAYKRLAKTTDRSQKQLLGRHLQQRRTLFARCIKENDNRTALHVLRDEAELEGLYPGVDGKKAPPGPQYSPLSRLERTVRLLAAEAAGDQTQICLLKHATPIHVYQHPDTMMVELMLHTMTLMYVSEQLEWAVMCINGMFCDLIQTNDDLDYMAKVAAYLFRIGREGWLQFTRSIGVDAAYLLQGNYYGEMLHIYGDTICEIAPSAEELLAKMTKRGKPPSELKTAADNYRSWRKLFSQICPI